MAGYAKKTEAIGENGAGYAGRILTKLFTEPIPPAFPNRSSTNFTNNNDNEHELLVRGRCYGTYRPAQWADPLLPLNVSVNGVDSTVKTLPLVTIGIRDISGPQPKIFDYLRAGLDELERISYLAMSLDNDNRDVELEDEIREQLYAVRWKFPILFTGSFVSSGVVPGSTDVSALIGWASKSIRKTGISYLLDNYRGYCSLDEGPFIRLELLMILLAPDDWFEHGTSVVKNMAMNGYTKESSIKRWWSPPVEDSTDTQIGSRQGSSRLYVRSISEYTRVLKGDSEVSIKCDGQSVCPSEIKFIPVKASWKNSKWLLPFILAHTTTEWWNHALQINLKVAVSKPADENAKMVIKTVPKAATVHYPGRYKHICLVVVDRDRLDSKSYSIGGFETTYDGNPNFSQYVYQALGRLPSDSLECSISIDDCYRALKMMEEAMRYDLTTSKHPLLLGILATSRFCGFGVWPSPTGKDPHIRGVMSFNSQEPVKVGDSTARDWSDLVEDPEKQQLSEAVKFFTVWRVDPMLQFDKGQVRFRNYQEPLLEEVIQSIHVYNCGETCDEYRILAYACAFPEVGHYNLNYSSPASFLNNTIAYGSVMLGLMTWYTAEKGITLFYHNIFNREPYETYDEREACFESLSKLTNHFFRKRCKDHSHEDVLSIVGKHLSLEKNWHRVWYSGVIPWWFARAVAKTFGWNKWPIVRTPVSASIATINRETQKDEDLDFFGEALGFHIQGKTCENTELCFLAQAIAYEKSSTRFFKIATPDATQHYVQTNWISWYYNALNDTPPIRYQEDLDYYNHRVELNTLVLPKANTETPPVLPKAFVSILTQFQSKNDFQMRNGIQCPQVPNGWCQ